MIVKMFNRSKLFSRVSLKKNLAALCLVLIFHANSYVYGQLPYHNKQESALKLSQPLSMLWNYDSGETLIASPAYNHQAAFLVLEKGNIVALSLQNGTVRWRTAIGGTSSLKPVADEQGVYIATQTKNGDGMMRVSLRSISSVSGITLWIKEIPDNPRFLFAGEKSVVAVSNRGDILALDKASGDKIWSRELSGATVFDAKTADGKLYVSTPETISQINLTDGRIDGSYQTPETSFEHLWIIKNMVYGSTDDKVVTAFDWATRRFVWRAKLDTTIKSITPADNVLIATSTNNYVYGFSLGRGKRIWKRDIGSRILAEPIAVSGSVLLAPLSGETCVVLDVRQGRVQNLVSVGQSITAASPNVINNLLLLPVQNGLRAYTSQPVVNSSNSPTKMNQSPK